MNIYSVVKSIFKDYRINKGYNIRFYNFWRFSTPEEVWFYRFIKHHGIDSGYKRKLNFYSVLGPIQGIKCRRRGVNIFFSGENLHVDRFKDYSDYFERQPFDLSLGFDLVETEKYMRLPLWIHYMFEPESTYEDIQKRVEELSFSKPDNRTKFCSLVASHDWNGIRGQMIDALQSIGSIESAGRFQNNTDELHTMFKDNKLDYILQFKFNICPENSNADGYVTEKLFESIAAGCIPIYWGSNNQPEPDILNREAVLFWNNNGDNSQTLNKITEILADEKKYLEFVSQPRFSTNAADIIWSYFENFELILKELLLKL
jgi:hypothetical protein